MKVLVTGAAGFIGYHVAKALLARGTEVVGIDNLSSYYDPALKRARLAALAPSAQFRFIEADVSAMSDMIALFQAEKQANAVVHLAAQAGVRHSFTNPGAYVTANVMGQVAVFEAARHLTRCENLVYASSSSVYGRNATQPFSVHHETRQPTSIYAATKLACEHLAEAYAWNTQSPTVGLRFFTVYGPWGRPDMAPWLFADAIAAGRPIRIFNHGKMARDFTYIDDIVGGVLAALMKPPQAAEGLSPHRIYNLGNNHPETLMDFVGAFEQAFGKTAEKIFEPLQPGDVISTAADITESTRDLGYVPKTSIDEGVPRFVDWFKRYRGIA